MTFTGRIIGDLSGCSVPSGKECGRRHRNKRESLTINTRYVVSVYKLLKLLLCSLQYRPSTSRPMIPWYTASCAKFSIMTPFEIKVPAVRRGVYKGCHTAASTRILIYVTLFTLQISLQQSDWLPYVMHKRACIPSLAPFSPLITFYAVLISIERAYAPTQL